jgi:hypothetical protein
MESNADYFPVQTKTIILTLIPGLIATLGLFNDAWSGWSWVGVVLLALFIILGWLTGNQRLPDWTLMAGGLLVGIAQPVVLGILGVLAALATHTTPSPTDSLFVTALPWIGTGLVLYHLRGRGLCMPKVLLWVAAITACCILVRVKYFVLYGFSWDILGQMLGISLWAAGTLLLPVLLTGLMPKRHGRFRVLFAAGATFAWYQVLIDNGTRVSAGLDSQGTVWIYFLVVRCLFIVLGPWLFLGLRDARWKLAGLTACICASAAVNILISGLVRGDFTAVIWLSAIPYILSIGLSPVLADEAAGSG